MTPTSDGTLAVAMDPSYDASLYARAGSCTSTLQQLACSETGGTGMPEAISFSVTAGTKYWIFADGHNQSAGAYSLDFTLLP